MKRDSPSVQCASHDHSMKQWCMLSDGPTSALIPSLATHGHIAPLTQRVMSKFTPLSSRHTAEQSSTEAANCTSTLRPFSTWNLMHTWQLSVQLEAMKTQCTGLRLLYLLTTQLCPIMHNAWWLIWGMTNGKLAGPAALWCGPSCWVWTVADTGNGQLVQA